MAGTEQPAGGSYFVGKRDELIEAKRSCRTIEDRDILVIHHQGAFYAIDSYCYHAGGPLENGDIEELNSKLCIICPKHKYKIAIADGEGIYKATDPTEKTPVRRWLSKGIKQRVHTVIETNGDVYVKLSERPGWLESDFFQGEKGKLQREKVEAEEKEAAEKEAAEKKASSA